MLLGQANSHKIQKKKVMSLQTENVEIKRKLKITLERFITLTWKNDLLYTNMYENINNFG